MKLKEWIRKNKLSDVDFGKKIGLTPAGISRIINLNRYPSAEVMLKIFIQTNGEIQPNDLLEDAFNFNGKLLGFEGLEFR